MELRRKERQRRKELLELSLQGGLEQQRKNDMQRRKNQDWKSLEIELK